MAGHQMALLCMRFLISRIHNYPPDIQEEYFKTHKKLDVSYKSKNVILTKALGILIFTGILFICSLAAGAETLQAAASPGNAARAEKGRALHDPRSDEQGALWRYGRLCPEAESRRL